MKTASRFAATLVLVLLASTSRAALVDVGNGLINHPAANLTWVADANLFLTMATADATLVTKVVAAWTDGPIPTLAGDGTTHTIVAADFNAATGKMNWYGARAWVNYLKVTHYKGYSDWRLPEVGTASLQTGGCLICVPGDGFAVNSSEWWRLFFEELGGTAHVPIATSNNGSYALFQNIEGDAFWGNAQNGTTTALFRDGGEQIRDQTNVVGFRAWAVRDGQSVANPPLAPYISFSPGNPIFAVTPYNTPTTGTVTLKNSGTGPATIASITASGDFTVDAQLRNVARGERDLRGQCDVQTDGPVCAHRHAHGECGHRLHDDTEWHGRPRGQHQREPRRREGGQVRHAHLEFVTTRGLRGCRRNAGLGGAADAVRVARCYFGRGGHLRIRDQMHTRCADPPGRPVRRACLLL